MSTITAIIVALGLAVLTVIFAVLWALDHHEQRKGPGGW